MKNIMSMHWHSVEGHHFLLVLRKLPGAILVILLMLLCFFITELNGLEIKAEDIMRRSNVVVFYGGQDAVCDVKMTTLGPYSIDQDFEFKIFRKNVNDRGDQKFFIQFSEPRFFSGVSYMVWKHINAEDERWLYVPILDLVHRIDPRDKRLNFLGAHFSYEDISGRDVDEDEHELVEFNGTGHYLIKSIPKDAGRVDFKYYLSWIRERDLIPVKVEFYDDENLLMRLIEVQEIRRIQGYATVTRSLIKDLKVGGETMMSFTNVRYNSGLKDGIFSEEQLRDGAITIN